MMTPDEAAWVREHVWTGAMRRTYAEVPGFYLTCACQWNGPCLNDPHPGTHATCHMGVPMYNYETIISGRGGVSVAAFKRPYRHPTASATGWHSSHLAMVWIGGRRCRWQCTCPCDHRHDVAHTPENNPAWPVRYEVVELPGLLAGMS
ncbi:DUF6248 family natural product biosynthesis protein [Streptosporangium saharense]|uniref:DUF6248 family natural product biosynthesis protein n=1 Tax=Streptosporangium saharense TaxID=1706840 RepID=UPI0034293522